MADDGLTLAQRVRDKYPGAYDHLSDQQLEIAVQRKFPGVYDHVAKTPHETAKTEDYYKPGFFEGLAQNAGGELQAVGNALRHPIDTVGSMLHAKQAEDARVAEEARALRRGQQDNAYSMPGDRLADSIRKIPGVVYQHPLETAAAVAPGVPAMLRGAKRAAPAVVQGVKTAASHPIVKPIAGAALGYAHAGPLGAIEGAAGGGLLARVLKMLDKAEGKNGAPAPKPATTNPVKTGFEELGKQGRENLDNIEARQKMGSLGRNVDTKPSATTMDTAKLNDVGKRSFEDKTASDRMIAGMAKPKPVEGSRLSPRARNSGSDVAQAAIEKLATEKAPNTLLGSDPKPAGASMRSAPQMDSLHDVLERQYRNKIEAEQGTPMEAAYAGMEKPGDNAFTSRLVDVDREAPVPTAQELTEGVVDNMLNGKRGTPADVPDNPVAQALEAERQAASAEATTPSSRSKAARGDANRMSPNDQKVFADNIRKGMNEADALADMLRQRAERATVNQGRESAAAAARRKQQPMLPDIKEMLERTLLERSGK